MSLLGRQHGKSVYRLSIHTRARETFDIAINVAETMPPAELRDEVLWLLAAGAPPPLVEALRRLLPGVGHLHRGVHPRRGRRAAGGPPACSKGETRRL